MLIVNNLRHGTVPSCDTYPLREVRYEPGTQVIAFLGRDPEGIGANWRNVHISAGVMPLDDGTLSGIWDAEGQWEARTITLAEAKQQLDSFGAAFPPGTGREQPPSPVARYTCLYEAQTIEYFARTAPVIAIGSVVGSPGQFASVLVTEAFAGTSQGESLLVDNRVYSGGVRECNEQPVRDQTRLRGGEKVFVFLRTEIPASARTCVPSESMAADSTRVRTPRGIGVFRKTCLSKQRGGSSSAKWRPDRRSSNPHPDPLARRSGPRPSPPATTTSAPGGCSSRRRSPGRERAAWSRSW